MTALLAAVTLAIVSSPVVVFFARRLNIEPPGTLVQYSCATNGPVEACVEVFNDRGQHHVQSRLASTTDYSPESGKDKYWIKLDETRLVRPDGSVVASDAAETHEPEFTTKIRSSAQSDQCLAEGESVEGEVHGQLWFDGAWYPLSARTQPVYGNGDCEPEGPGFFQSITGARVRGGRLDADSVTRAMDGQHYEHGVGIVRERSRGATEGLARTRELARSLD